MHDINLVISSLRGGGAERSAVQLCNGWSQQGLSVVLTTLSGDDDGYALTGKVERQVLNLDFESTNPISGVFANIKRVCILRRALKAKHAKLVIGFSSTSNILVILASVGIGNKVIVAERNYPPNSMRSSIWRHLRKYLYRYADRVVVQTQDGADWLRVKTLSKTITVIPNSVSLPIPSGQPVISPKKFVSENEQLLLAVGNIHHQKGFDLLVDALNKTAIVSSNWVLVIVGAGDSRVLEDKIKTSGLGENVRIAGRVGNIGDWYQRADAFVLSSRYEGFPNVLLEAMASGCAVVSFDCMTGPADIIQHENNGLLVPPQNVVALGAALSRIMEDECLREQLSTNARSVTDTFSNEKLFANWSLLISSTGKS